LAKSGTFFEVPHLGRTAVAAAAAPLDTSKRTVRGRSAAAIPQIVTGGAAHYPALALVDGIVALHQRGSARVFHLTNNQHLAVATHQNRVVAAGRAAAPVARDDRQAFLWRRNRPRDARRVPRAARSKVVATMPTYLRRWPRISSLRTPGRARPFRITPVRRPHPWLAPSIANTCVARCSFKIISKPAPSREDVNSVIELTASKVVEACRRSR